MTTSAADVPAVISSLTAKDELVLGRLFDPEAATSSTVVVDETLPSDSYIYDQKVLEQLRQREKHAILDIETLFKDREGLPTQYDKDLTKAFEAALETFDTIVKDYPTYASGYVNRAQVRRFSLLLTMTPMDIITQTTVLSDLQKALDLALPSSPTASISPAYARILASAYTQRATLYLAVSKQLQEEDMSNGAMVIDGTGDESKAEQYEELASKDFFLGGRYGNEIAGAMGVRVNPYAKACGNIVQQALRMEVGAL